MAQLVRWGSVLWWPQGVRIPPIEVGCSGQGVGAPVSQRGGLEKKWGLSLPGESTPAAAWPASRPWVYALCTGVTDELGPSEPSPMPFSCRSTLSCLANSR